MKDDHNRAKSRSVPPLLVGVVLSLLVLLAIAGLGSYRDLSAARARQMYLMQSLEETRDLNEQLVRRIGRLKNDPASLERVAREQYRMQKPGDVVIVFPASTETKSPTYPRTSGN